MNELLRRLLYLPEQASTVAPAIDHLHYFVIGCTMLGAFGVFLVAFVFLLLYRRRPGHGLTARIAAPHWLEAIFVGGPLSLFLLIWVLGFRQYMQLELPPQGALEVYVTGKQWMWKFAYPQGPSSVGVLYAPAGRPVKLFITSRDVIHSFFVPAFRIKKDAVPGRYTTAWFEARAPGVYQVRCAEYCGDEHSRMLADVVVLKPEDFERWMAEPTSPVAGLAPKGGDPPTWKPEARQGLAAQGERVAAEYGCLRCHTPDGTPHIGPTWAGLFGKKRQFTDGSTAVADTAYLTESMMDPTVRLVVGFAPLMPSYQGKLEPGETAALVEYIKSLPAPLPEAQRKAPPNAGGSP